METDDTRLQPVIDLAALDETKPGTRPMHPELVRFAGAHEVLDLYEGTHKGKKK